LDGEVEVSEDGVGEPGWIGETDVAKGEGTAYRCLFLTVAFVGV
jgi:hypothetical protein